MPSEELYVVSDVRATPIASDQILSMPDADSQGRVLFRSALPREKYTDTLVAYIEATKAALAKAANLEDGFHVEEVKLNLGLDASVGCTFLSEGKLSASIEVTIRKV